LIWFIPFSEPLDGADHKAGYALVSRGDMCFPLGLGGSEILSASRAFESHGVSFGGARLVISFSAVFSLLQI
jgi:hypothetical protein